MLLLNYWEIFSLKKCILFIQQGSIKLIKSEKDIYLKWMLFFWNFYASKKSWRTKMFHGFRQNIKQHSCFQHW